MTKVTAIIPAFNVEGFVAETIESALAQTHKDLEVIVVDDGSTDKTLSILRTFGDAIRVVEQPNGGPASARNTGARIAAGEWIAFLDADDVWVPGKIEKQLALADSETQLVYTDRENFGACDRMSRRLSDVATLWEDNLFENLMYGNFITLSSCIIRRTTFEQMRGFDEDRSLISVEDWEFFLRLAQRDPAVRACGEALTLYRWHPAKISLNHDSCRRQRIEVLDRALKTARGRTFSSEAVRRARANVWTASAWYVSESSRWKALQWYARSLVDWPWDSGVYRSMVRCALGRG